MEKRTEFRRRTFAAVLSVAALAFAVAADAKTYYVSQTGDDANDGKKPETAFRTANKGFETINKSANRGSELVIYPGTYAMTGAIGCNGGADESKRSVVRSSTGNPDDVVLDAQGLYECLRLANYITVSGITVSNGVNRADSFAAGIRFSGTGNSTDRQIIVTNCVVTCCRNVLGPTTNAAAVVMYGNNLMVDCTIRNNTAEEWRGAGVLMVRNNATSPTTYNGEPKMERCRIEGNVAAKEGAGVYVASFVGGKDNEALGNLMNVEIEGCEIIGNISTGANYGAGVFCADNMDVRLSGCTVSENVPGGIRQSKGLLNVADSVINGNRAQNGAGVDLVPSADLTLYCTNTVFRENSVEKTGGAVRIYEYAKAFFDDCRFEGNSVTNASSDGDRGGGAVWMAHQGAGNAKYGFYGYCSASNCVFASNTSATRGGAMGCTWNTNFCASVVNCVFTNNASVRQGGGLCIREVVDGATLVPALAPATIRNCLFAYNRTTGMKSVDSSIDANGAGICLVTKSAIVVENCTIVTNGTSDASFESGGVHHRLGGTLRNCIVAFNTAGGEPEPDTWAGWETNNYVNCCGWPAVGKFTEENRCMNVYPGFVDWPAGDFSLKSSSPCRNRGARSPWMEGATDVAGNKRIDGAGVDIGCYEYQITFFGFALVVK